ncbi:superoxide dismutase, Fe-Mn family [Rhizobiales bacterium GAS113]|nr:superoxide dismutase, Fe-Mn family [Rhizobiales bacterium GAS113]
MNHHIAPIPCKPWALNGLPDRLIVGHYENNYGAAVRSLNAIRDRLASIDLAAVPSHDIRALKQEELVATGSVILHELYFGSLGLGSSGFSGDGKIPDSVSFALQQFGGVAAWRREFVALAQALSGRSGWVLLSYSRRDGRLHNQIAFDDSQAMMDAVPVLALDMYEHAYHLEFGANATAYIDAFMRNIDWAAVGNRLLEATGDRASPRVNSTGDALPSISVEELATQLAMGKRVQVLDARPRHYFSRATDMMEGATWRDPERVDEWCEELSADAPVAVYCAYGFHVGCGVTAALRERGFDARYVEGGLSAWYGMGGARSLPSASQGKLPPN